MRRPQRVLVAAGVLTFAVGAGVALLANELANPHAALKAGEPVVMSEECLTCHSDVFRQAERSVQPMTIQSPAATTVAVAAVEARAEALPVASLDDGPRPYAVSDPNAEPVRGAVAHRRLWSERGLPELPALGGLNTQIGEAAGRLCKTCHTPAPMTPGGL